VAHDTLGIALQAGGRLDDAIGAFRAAVAIEPRVADAHNNLGMALRLKGRDAEAVASFRDASTNVT
jgi:Flp pilus assembly protein TadD